MRFVTSIVLAFILLEFIAVTKAQEENSLGEGESDNRQNEDNPDWKWNVDKPGRRFPASKKVCFEELGCLGIDSSWYKIPYRMINWAPLTRDEINTTFLLYTRQHSSTGTTFKTKDLDKISNEFNPTLPVKFIIHGYTQSIQTDPWMTELARALLKVGDFNVIIVNWGDGAHRPYANALANIRVVGLEIAFLVRTLVDRFGIYTQNVHLIGHSLGAQVAGYAGERIPNLGRITGSDPAGPGFHTMPKFVRLDPSDALFVDVIHTNAKRNIFEIKFGIPEPVGHLDFYINGGVQQPGCEPSTLLAANYPQPVRPSDIAFCSHRKAVAYIISSLTSNVDFVGYECSNYETFLKGDCYSCGEDNSHCAKLGLDAAEYPAFLLRNRVPLYLKTKANPPYSIYHYHVIVKMAGSSNSSGTAFGNLYISIRGTKAQASDILLGNKIQPGSAKFFLFTSELDFGKITQVDLRSDSKPPFVVTSVEISILNNYPESKRVEGSVRLCAGEERDYRPTSSGQTSTFSYPCNF